MRIGLLWCCVQFEPSGWQSRHSSNEKTLCIKETAVWCALVNAHLTLFVRVYKCSFSHTIAKSLNYITYNLHQIKLNVSLSHSHLCILTVCLDLWNCYQEPHLPVKCCVLTERNMRNRKNTHIEITKKWHLPKLKHQHSGSSCCSLTQAQILSKESKWGNTLSTTKHPF